MFSSDYYSSHALEYYVYSIVLSLFVLGFLLLVQRKEMNFFNFFLNLQPRYILFFSFVPIFNFVIAVGNLIVFLRNRSLSKYADENPHIETLYNLKLICNHYKHYFEKEQKNFPIRYKLYKKISNQTDFFLLHPHNSELVIALLKNQPSIDESVDALGKASVYLSRPSEELFLTIDTVLETFLSDAKKAEETIYSNWFEEEGMEILSNLNQVHFQGKQIESEAIDSIRSKQNSAI